MDGRRSIPDWTISILSPDLTSDLWRFSFNPLRSPFAYMDEGEKWFFLLIWRKNYCSFQRYLTICNLPANGLCIFKTLIGFYWKNYWWQMKILRKTQTRQITDKNITRFSNIRTIFSFILCPAKVNDKLQQSRLSRWCLKSFTENSLQNSK